MVSIFIQPTHAKQLNASANARNATHPSNARIACNAVDATANASKARNAVDTNAPDATANARNAPDAKTHPTQATHATQKQNASHTRCTTCTVFCVLKAYVLITSCQHLVAFLLYKRLHRRCRRRRYWFWVKEIGLCNCLPCIVPNFSRSCIYRVQSYRTGYSLTKLIVIKILSTTSRKCHAVIIEYVYIYLYEYLIGCCSA